MQPEDIVVLQLDKYEWKELKQVWMQQLPDGESESRCSA